MNVDEILREAAAELHAEVRAGVDAESALAEVQHRRPTLRRWLPAAAAVVVVLALAAAIVAVLAADDEQDGVTAVPPPTTVELEVDGPAPGVSEGVDVVVTPATGVVDGQEVQVVVEGVPDEDALSVELAMCLGDVMEVAPLEGQTPDTDRCESSSPYETIEPVDGRLDAPFVIDQFIEVGGDPAVDCARAPVRCGIGVFYNRGAPPGEEPVGPELVGLVGVGFAPAPPLEEMEVSVTPAAALEHGSLVTVEGSGFEQAVDSAAVCAPSLGPEVCVGVQLPTDGPDDELRTDDGAFRFEVRVWRVVPAPVIPQDASEEPEWADCAEVGCVLQLRGADGREAPPVPLGFSDATPTPTGPDVEVSPTSGLRPGDPVTVTLRGMTPGVEVSIDACLLDGGSCTFGLGLGSVTADDAGVATTTIPATDPAEYGQTCTEVGACGVGVSAPLPGEADVDPLLWGIRPVPVQYAPA